MASEVRVGPAEAPAEAAGRGSAAPWLALAAALAAGGAWLLTRRGYEGGVAVWVGAAALGLGVAALARALRRGWRTAAAAAAAAVAVAVALGPTVSRRYYVFREERAWERFRAGGGEAKGRWLAYRGAVPEQFRRPDPEKEWLLEDVNRSADPHWLRQILADLQDRHGDDPAFEPVRRRIAELLARGGE
jgi:hypothetical protein